MQIGTYIRRQPSTLAALPAALRPDLDKLACLRERPERIVLLGTGSSMNALLAGADALEEGTGASVIAKEPEAFLRLPPKPTSQRTLVLAASQSGMSITTIEAVRLSVAKGFPTLVMTGEADSLITQAGAELIVMPIGPGCRPETMGYRDGHVGAGGGARLAGRSLDLSRPGGPAGTDGGRPGLAATRGLITRFGVPDYTGRRAGDASRHRARASLRSPRSAACRPRPSTPRKPYMVPSTERRSTARSLPSAQDRGGSESRRQSWRSAGRARATCGRPQSFRPPTAFDLDVAGRRRRNINGLPVAGANSAAVVWLRTLAIARGLEPGQDDLSNLGARKAQRAHPREA